MRVRLTKSLLESVTTAGRCSKLALGFLTVVSLGIPADLAIIGQERRPHPGLRAVVRGGAENGFRFTRV